MMTLSFSPGTPSEQIDSNIAAISAIFGQIAPSCIKPGERPLVGGSLFREARLLVYLILYGLKLSPALFPELRFGAPELAEVQEQANSWQVLALMLGTLARQASDNHMEAQARAIQMSRTVLDNIKHGCARPELAPNLDHQARGLAMIQAFDLLEDIQGRKNQKRVVAKRQRPAAPTPAPAAPAMPAPVMSAPPMPAPVMSAPPMPAPIMSAPVMSTPVMSAPVMSTPVTTPIMSTPIVTARPAAPPAPPRRRAPRRHYSLGQSQLDRAMPILSAKLSAEARARRSNPTDSLPPDPDTSPGARRSTPG